ncbi:uncharacterized protein LOC127798033 [Diospyros lotus]|uniref:uncharacterized protein LOC127798033 n=1 Tax=Diospyros lotus TaxID=55363 RepID=UPI00224FD7B4|nr:uncharacterized protein LOC127798033 [Diospyros lotus]
MARKRSPIFQKNVPILLQACIFIAKLKKPIVSKLLLLLKKYSSRPKKLKLLHRHHYNHGGYLREYQFSPSSTPLIGYHIKPPFKKGIKYRDMYSVFFACCKCFGRWADEVEDCPLPLPAAEDAASERLPDSGGEEDSIDERAERFIERFYQDMRMQRQESVLQLMDYSYT